MGLAKEIYMEINSIDNDEAYQRYLDELAYEELNYTMSNNLNNDKE